MKASEIITLYSKGECTIEEANKLLEENGHIVRLAEGLKEISEKERAETRVDPAKGICEGWALVNIGVGSPEKMQVKDGKLVYPLGNTGFDYIAYMGGYKFAIPDGEKLILAK